MAYTPRARAHASPFPRFCFESSTALAKHRRAGLMANEAGAGISPHLRTATARESGGVRIEAAADALTTMAGHAVALDVTRDAGVQISLGLERVMSGLARRVAPDRFRRMESPGVT